MSNLHPDTVGRAHHGPGRPRHVPQNVPVPQPWTRDRWPVLVLPALAVVQLVATVWLDVLAPSTGPGQAGHVSPPRRSFGQTSA